MSIRRGQKRQTIVTIEILLTKRENSKFEKNASHNTVATERANSECNVISCQIIPEDFLFGQPKYRTFCVVYPDDIDIVVLYHFCVYKFSKLLYRLKKYKGV